MAAMHPQNRGAGSIAPSDVEALNTAISRIVSAGLWTSRVAAAVLLLLGIVIWTEKGDALIPVHVVAGVVLVLALWTLATIAARAGASRLTVTLAVGWSFAAAALGLTQQDFIAGSWHWTIQVAHLVIAMAMVAWCQYLALLIRRSAGDEERG